LIVDVEQALKETGSTVAARSGGKKSGDGHHQRERTRSKYIGDVIKGLPNRPIIPDKSTKNGDDVKSEEDSGAHSTKQTPEGKNVDAMAEALGVASTTLSDVLTAGEGKPLSEVKDAIIQGAKKDGILPPNSTSNFSSAGTSTGTLASMQSNTSTHSGTTTGAHATASATSGTIAGMIPVTFSTPEKDSDKA
jgi:hypothetical protein